MTSIPTVCFPPRLTPAVTDTRASPPPWLLCTGSQEMRISSSQLFLLLADAKYRGRGENPGHSNVCVGTTLSHVVLATCLTSAKACQGWRRLQDHKAFLMNILLLLSCWQPPSSQWRSQLYLFHQFHLDGRAQNKKNKKNKQKKIKRHL